MNKDDEMPGCRFDADADCQMVSGGQWSASATTWVGKDPREMEGDRKGIPGQLVLISRDD